MQLNYYDNFDLIMKLLNTIEDQSHDNTELMIIDRRLVIFRNGLVKFKYEPTLETMNLLKHPKLKAITLDNLDQKWLLHFDRLPKSIHTMIVRNISDIKEMEIILNRRYATNLYSVCKIHYVGPMSNKAVNLIRINPNVTELVLPLLDNIDDVINLNPSLVVIGVHGTAYFYNQNPYRVWSKLLNIMERNQNVMFVLFFNRYEHKAVDDIKRFNNARITMFTDF